MKTSPNLRCKEEKILFTRVRYLQTCYHGIWLISWYLSLWLRVDRFGGVCARNPLKGAWGFYKQTFWTNLKGYTMGHVWQFRVMCLIDYSFFLKEPQPKSLSRTFWQIKVPASLKAESHPCLMVLLQTTLHKILRWCKDIQLFIFS